MFNVLVHYIKDEHVQLKNYVEIADNECTAMNKALLDCKKEFNINITDAHVVNIEEVYFLA